MATSGLRGGVQTDGYDRLIAKLGLLEDRLKAPGPVLQDIAVMFEVMEAQRFASGGPAPEFGISKQWKGPDPETAARKNGKMVLIDKGYLRAAAVNPVYESLNVFTKEITLRIDPRDKGYKRRGGWGNYGAALNQNPDFKFVQITPMFRILSKEIAVNYFMHGLRDGRRAPRVASVKDGYKSRRNPRKFPNGRDPEAAKEYANYTNRNRGGGRLDHRTTASKVSQKEYNDVVNAQATGNMSAFKNEKAFEAASKRVAKYVTSASGNFEKRQFRVG